MGVPELIVIVLLLVWLTIPSILQKYYPNRLWVGMVLSFIFGTAHLYLPGGWKFAILTGVVYVFLKTLFETLHMAPGLAFPLTFIFQAVLMYWRFLKLRSPVAISQPSVAADASQKRSIKYTCVDCNNSFQESELKNDALFCPSCGGRVE